MPLCHIRNYIHVSIAYAHSDQCLLVDFFSTIGANNALFILEILGRTENANCTAVNVKGLQVSDRQGYSCMSNDPIPSKLKVEKTVQVFKGMLMPRKI